MLRQINWIHALIFFVLGSLLGQRFVHMHPLKSVSQQANQ